MADIDDDHYWTPNIGGNGSLHDLEDKEQVPRLFGLKSVSKAAAWALKRDRWPRERPVGFFKR